MVAPISDVELVRRRRAIYTGLRPYLPEHLLLQAVTIWQEKYVSKPMFALNKFLFEICDAPALAAQRGDIHRSLMESLWADESTLEPDPLICTVDNAAAPIFTHQSSSPHSMTGRLPSTQLFDVLCTAFFEMLSNEKSGADSKVRNALMQCFTEMLDVHSDVASRLNNWVLGVQPVLEDGLTEKDMQTLLHAVYVKTCDVVGPVKSDTLLSRALLKAEAMPAAKLFDVRRLL
ncbi:MAG: hypothetical protein ABL868_09330 [Sulfuriferula sp.]